MKRGPKPTFDRQAVLDRLVELFWEQGYQQTSHQDMRDRTGLSGSSLYNAFGDKRSIFDQVLTRYHELSRVLLQPLTAGSEGLADLVRWLDFLEARVGSNKTPPGCLMVATMGSTIGRDPDVQSQTQRNLEQVRNSIIETLRRAADLNEIMGDAIQPTAAMMTAAYVGILTAAQGAPTIETAVDMIGGLRRTVEALMP